jgi:hypothetical protein
MRVGSAAPSPVRGRCHGTLWLLQTLLDREDGSVRVDTQLPLHAVFVLQERAECTTAVAERREGFAETERDLGVVRVVLGCALPPRQRADVITARLGTLSESTQSFGALAIDAVSLRLGPLLEVWCPRQMKAVEKWSLIESDCFLESTALERGGECPDVGPHDVRGELHRWPGGQHGLGSQRASQDVESISEIVAGAVFVAFAPEESDELVSSAALLGASGEQGEECQWVTVRDATVEHSFRALDREAAERTQSMDDRVRRSTVLSFRDRRRGFVRLGPVDHRTSVDAARTRAVRGQP